MDKFVSHEDREHADYAPSGMYRTLNCHGSIAAQEGIPDTTSSYAEEGTECHEAAGAILEGHSYRKATAFLSDDQEWIVSEYTEYAFDLIDRMISRHGKENVKVWIETRVRSPEPGFERNHGTADLCILVIPFRTLAVIDLKAGYSPVDVGTPENPNAQLANYGFLSLDHHGLWDEVDFVRLTIVQPRCYEAPQTVTLTVKQLSEFADRVGGAIKAIERGDVARHAGDWCKYCKARGRCPELRQRARDGARMVFDAKGEAKPPRNYDDEELAAILEEAEAIKLHYEGVMAHVSRMLERGRFKGQGWKLVQKRAMAKWTVTEEELATAVFKSGGNKSDLYKDKLLTPLQLAKELKAKKIDLDLADYFVKESSGYSLARESDKRPAIRPDPFKDADNE